MSRSMIRTCVAIWRNTEDYTVIPCPVLCFYRWHGMQHHWLQCTDRLYGLVSLYVLHYSAALSPPRIVRYPHIYVHFSVHPSIHSCIYHSIHLINPPNVSALHCTTYELLCSLCTLPIWGWPIALSLSGSFNIISKCDGEKRVHTITHPCQYIFEMYCYDLCLYKRVQCQSDEYNFWLQAISKLATHVCTG